MKMDTELVWRGKAGYKIIADIGKERIRRAANKIRGEHGLTAPKDLGFKVFRVREDG